MYACEWTALDAVTSIVQHLLIPQTFQCIKFNNSDKNI